MAACAFGSARRFLIAVASAWALACVAVPANAQAGVGDCTTTCHVAAGGDDAANHGTTPSDAFATIQKALDTVASGGTVVVGPGTFSGGATVSRSVVLQGAQAGVDARNRSAAESIVTVPSTGAGVTVTGSALEVVVDGFRFSAATSGSGNGVTTAAGLTGSVHVRDSIFSNLGRGVNGELGTATLEIRRNHFAGFPFTAQGQAIRVGSTTGDGAPATVTENLMNGTGSRIGISLAGGAGGSQITFNVITGSPGLTTVGISVGASVTASGTVVDRNAITANTNGLNSSTTATVSATCNWWGATNGPAGIGGGSGNSVNVGAGATAPAVSPWLTSNNLVSDPCTGTGTSIPGSCTTTCYVATTGDDANTGADATSPLRTIQAAINRVTAGGTVIVAPGLYNPNFTDVTKSVTLLGARQGQDPRAGSRTATDPATESIIQSNSGLRIVGLDVTVTVDGFAFQEKTVGSSVGISTGAAASDVGATVTVRNTIFHLMNIGIGSTFGANASSLAIAHNLFTGGKTGIQAMGPGADGAATFDVSSNRFAGQSLRSIDAVVWNGATIRDNAVVGGGGLSNASIQIGGCSACAVSGNTLTAPEGVNGIAVIGTNGASSNSVVEDNAIVDPSRADNLAIFVGLATGTLVEGNAITGARAAGISVHSVASQTTVRGNTIGGAAAIGVRIESGAVVERNVLSGVATGVDLSAAADPAATRVNRNAIAGNAAGLTSATSSPVDATCNWWGAPDGPAGPGGGSGDSIAGSAVFQPLLVSSDLDGDCVRVARFAVAKDFSDDDPRTVTVALACSSGRVTATDASASEADTAEFVVSGFEPGTTCTATEVVPAGYSGDASDCQAVPLEEVGECTLVNVPLPPQTTSVVTEHKTPCAAVVAGAVADVEEAGYNVTSTGTIRRVFPDTVLAWTKVVATGSSFAVDVDQARTGAALPLLGIAGVSVFDGRCQAANRKRYTIPLKAPDRVSVRFAGVAPGDEFWIAVKYATAPLRGAPARPPRPTADYAFTTRVDGVQTSVETLAVRPLS